MMKNSTNGKKFRIVLYPTMSNKDVEKKRTCKVLITLRLMSIYNIS